MSEEAEICAFHPMIIAVSLIGVRDRPAAIGVVSTCLRCEKLEEEG